MRANLPPLPDSFTSQQGPGSSTATVHPPPGIISLHQLPSSCRTRIGKRPEQRHLCPISGSAKVTVGPPGAFSSTLPISFLNCIRIRSESALITLPPHLPRLISSSHCFFPQSISSVLSTSLGHVIEWKEYGDACSLCSNTSLSTCWPCEIQSYLPLLPPPPPSPTCILSSTTWTA